MEVTEKKENEKKNEMVMETPNAVGLQVKLEPSHFHDIDEKSVIAIKCIAEIASNLVETESRVPVVNGGAYANNQRLSTGDRRNKGDRSHRVYPGQQVSLLLLCYFSSLVYE